MAAGPAQTGGPLTAPAAATRSPDRLETALCSGVAMLLAIIATSKGPGLSPDSVAYLSTGINVAGSHGLVTLAGEPLTVFPPGLPMVAAFGEAIGLGAEATLRIVSVAAFGAIVALGSSLLRRVVTHRALVLGSTALLAGSPVLLGVSKMAWSEPPFVVVTLLFLLVLCRVWARRALTGVDVAVLSGLCWMAFFLRYAGVTLIAAGGIALLVAVRPLDRRSLGRIMGFGVLSATAPVVWMLRNHAADGTYLGPRRASPDSLRTVVVHTAATIGEWLVPVHGLTTRHLALIGATGALLAVGGLAVAVRSADSQGLPPDEAAAARRARLLCCAVFIVVYVGYLTTSTLSTAISLPNSRYLSPVYVPGVVVAAAGIAALLERSSRARWRGLIGVVLLVFLASQLLTSTRDARDGATDGIELNASAVIESAVAAEASRVVDAAAADPVVYSNSPNALWAATRMQPIHFAPRDAGVRDLPVEGELEEFARQVACTSATTYLVFYLYGGDPRVVRLAEMRAVVDVERVAAANDGAVFRVTSHDRGICGADGPARVRRRLPASGEPAILATSRE